MKNTANSKVKIVEKKLEDMFTKRKGMAMKYLKNFLNLKLKKREIAGLMASSINRILNKKNEVYTFFYLLKYKRQDVGKPL